MVRGRGRRSGGSSGARQCQHEVGGWAERWGVLGEEDRCTHRIRVTLESVQDFFFSQIPDLDQG